jgi:hypothetical protein
MSRTFFRSLNKKLEVIFESLKLSSLLGKIEIIFTEEL